MQVLILRPSAERDYLKFCEGLTARGSEARRAQFGRLPDLTDEPPKLSRGAWLVLSVFAVDDEEGAEDAKCHLVEHLSSLIAPLAYKENWKIGDRSSCLASIAVTEYVTGRRVSDVYCGKLFDINADSFRKTWRGEKLDITKKWLFDWQKELQNHFGISDLSLV